MATQIDEIRKSLEKYGQIKRYPKADKKTVQSAVLIPLIANSQDLAMVFTHRSNNLVRHAGQVSFPGGAREIGDKSPVDTALRETQEEIGLPAEKIEVIGQMYPYNSSTGFCVFPIIGYVQNLKGLKRNFEVDKLFCVPLIWLNNPENSYRADYFNGGQQEHKLLWYFFEFDGETIWGLTAQITKDFLTLIQKER